ncbi:glycoside hydrolase [Zooshikella harenae]|uniref:Glycoside hydrolase n=1 Tax=Zooshikella harenae TaxID=2827238 RepID=A0ABS5ZFZ5_9GAMM|nr:glycoside hydrolase [Zooshikella harenae]MBU2712982.1 glycoside hydrolase [Zooshikella harenae]
MRKQLQILFNVIWLSACSNSYAITLQSQQWQVDIEPSTLAMTSTYNMKSLILSNGGTLNDSKTISSQPVAITQQTSNQLEWQWPKQKLTFLAKLNGTNLQFTIHSDQPQSLTWLQQPQTNVNALILPLGEGSYIPLNNTTWQKYLINELQTVNTTQDLKLPLWSQQFNNLQMNWVLNNPFNNQITFSQQSKNLTLTATHKFTALNLHEPVDVTINLDTQKNVISGAKVYRSYLKTKKQFVNLTHRLKNVNYGDKIIGASHFYVWGMPLFSYYDVKNWPGLISWLKSRPGKDFINKLQSKEQRLALQKVKQNLPQWEKKWLAHTLNSAFIASIPQSDNKINTQVKHANATIALVKEKIGPFLNDKKDWGDGLSNRLLARLQKVGIKRAWLGLDDWRVGFYHPEAVQKAKEIGYLVGAYDSYNTALPLSESNGSWMSSEMGEGIFNKCGIIQADGKWKTGFKQRGRYTNPSCLTDYYKNRVSQILQYAKYNSYFLDVDATGMVFEDYHPEHTMTEKLMALSREARLQWFSNHFRLPLGSEDGNAVTHRGIIFAHGLQTPVFGWGNQSMFKNKQSNYYLGNWWPDNQPSLFFKQADILPKYRTTVFDPRFKVPLYQTVFHDAVITTHHWYYDNFKFPTLRPQRELFSLLYAVPPLYHINYEVLNQRLPTIKQFDQAFSPLHQQLATQAVKQFLFLNEERTVHYIQYEDNSEVWANFSNKSWSQQKVNIPAQSMVATLANGQIVKYQAQ